MHKGRIVIGIVASWLMVSSLGAVPATTATVSGRVLDVDGNPIPGFLIAVQYVEISENIVWLTHLFEEDEHVLGAYTALPRSITDDTGRFTFSDIIPGLVQFIAQPPHLPPDEPLPPDFDVEIFEPDSEILSIKSGVITFYPYNQEPPPFGGITFSVEPGAHLQNLEVTVRPRMRIRAQVVFSDGAPLPDAEVQIDVRRQDFDGSGFGSSSGAHRTDDEGYFIHYVEEPAFYTVAVEFQGLSASSKRFALENGERRDDLVLSFDSDPVPVEPTPEREQPEREGEWVVNPENGHSYKVIHCDNPENARAKAVSEGAHLVSINDAAEQKWLVSIFGSAPYWIGLTDVEKEGEWRWTNGEAVGYTNWAPNEPLDADWGDENHVFMGLSPDGKWYDVGPESPTWRMTQMAIIEKGSLSPKPPKSEK
jgi:hypothetical protein